MTQLLTRQDTPVSFISWVSISVIGKHAAGERHGILLIRLKSMGDVVFTLPTVHALRNAIPDARITFMVSKEYASLLQGFNEVNKVIELDRERFRGFHPVKIARESIRLIRSMQSEGLRLTVDLQGYGETALLTRLSGAPQRWGTVYRPSRSWAYTLSVPRHADLHPVEDYLLLLRRGGFSEPPIHNHFVVPADAAAKAEEFFAINKLRPNFPTLFIQPFTSAPAKNWPLDRFLALARHWKGKNWQIIFGGGPSDRSALEPAGAAGHAIAAGTTLLVSAGLAQMSTLVLGGDTGLLHLAVAMAKRVIMVMRASMPGRTHPFQHPEWAVSPPNGTSLDPITIDLVNQRCLEACADLGISTQAPQP